MPDGILFTTTNRQLSGATGDFSLFGAQPGISFGPSPATAKIMPDDAGDGGSHDPALSHAADDAAVVPQTAGMMSDVADDLGSSTSSGTLAPPTAIIASPSDTEAVAAATGSSTPPAVLGSASYGLSANGTHTTTSTVRAELAGHAVEHSLSVTVDANADLAIGSHANLFTLPQAELLGAARDGLGAATDALSADLSVAGHAASLAAGAAMDSVDVLAGTDPAAGIATLLGLVETHEMTIGGPVAAAVDGGDVGGSILDTLAADMPGDALLGHDQPDHTDALASVVHNDDHGLLGGI